MNDGRVDPGQGGVSANALALGRLAGQEEGLDQFAFAADGHAGAAVPPRKGS
jgi:hypothetical protein